jgi:hypothetical protein
MDLALAELLSELRAVRYYGTSGPIDQETLSDHAFLFCTIYPFGPDGTGLRLCSANTMNRMGLCQAVLHGESVWSSDRGLAFDRARAVVQATYIHGLFCDPSDPIHIFVSQETTRYLEQALHELFPDTYVVCFVELWGNRGGTGCHEGGYATILRNDSAVKVESFDKIHAMIPCRHRAGEHEKNVGMLTVLSFEDVSFRIVNVHLPCEFVDSTLRKILVDERVLSLQDAYLVGDFNMAPRQKHFPDHTVRAIEHTGGNRSDHCLYLERKPLSRGLAMGGGGGSACVMPVESTPGADKVLKEVDVATLDVATPVVATRYVPPHRRFGALAPSA